MNYRIPYRLVFLGFFISIVLVFFWIRPLNSPWNRFIAGDGMGYYSYLPAKFIYHDSHYNFKWFNAVYAKEYISVEGSSPDDNFLVDYKGKKINKYYPGLSLLWLPFFWLAHACALVFQYPANGFSLPYQLAIGFASLFYLFLGLYYLRKLVFKISGKAWIACLVPILMFYGTHLFDYSVFNNSLSHVYSFCLITTFVYFAYRVLREEENRFRNTLLSFLLFFLVISVRPLNGLCLLILPAFFRKGEFRIGDEFKRPSWKHLLIIGTSLVVVSHNLWTLKISSGHYFTNTYSDEPFDFLHPQLLRSGFGFQYGLFLYAPLLFIALFGMFFGEANLKKWPLVLVFALVYYIYSAWWFWPITSRATVDFYCIPAILLSFFLLGFKPRSLAARTALVVLFLSLILYQLKHFQFRKGVLDPNQTYAGLYLRNFFRLAPSQQFPIPPTSILQEEVKPEDFEGASYAGTKSSQEFSEGKFSAVLDASNEYSKEFSLPVPDFLFEKGLARVRFSFDALVKGDVEKFQVYLNFYQPDGRQCLSLPFYMNTERIVRERWDRVEFGHEFSTDELSRLNGTRMAAFVWNSDKKSSLFIDRVETGFYLCDRSFEIVP